jgi:hypothetical protein
MRPFAYVIASGQVTKIHCLSTISAKLGESTTQWDNPNFATYMICTDMRVRTVEQPGNIFKRALLPPLTIVLVLVEEVLN